MARSSLLCVAPCCNIEYHGRIDIAIAASDVCEERATKVGRGTFILIDFLYVVDQVKVSSESENE